MRIKQKVKGDISILILSGSMQHGDTDTELVSVIQEYLITGQKHFIIDLGKIKYFYSTALGSMLASYKLVKKAGGELVLARSTRKIKSIMIQTQLIRFFTNYESVSEAVDGLTKEIAVTQ